MVSRNELINSRLNYSTIQNEFADKLSKAESDQFSALSNQFDSEATLTKLQNQLTNYERRAGFRFITAPQSGFVTKAIQAGIGETIKQGAKIVSIVKLDVDMAVELYVEPVDLPLIRLGQKARIEFDGWPAVVFTGWPNLSFGTFGGEVVAIDNMISKNNKYRILVAHDKNDEPWPDLVRVGSGARGFALLQDVPIWYELWRQLNGFPPDFYIDLDQAGDQMHNRGEEKKEKSTDKK
jgi:multidrug efflux pump subunit AcrA (membrane-fusion protein)